MLESREKTMELDRQMRNKMILERKEVVKYLREAPEKEHAHGALFKFEEIEESGEELCMVCVQGAILIQQGFFFKKENREYGPVTRLSKESPHKEYKEYPSSVFIDTNQMPGVKVASLLKHCAGLEELIEKAVYEGMNGNETIKDICKKVAATIHQLTESDKDFDEGMFVAFFDDLSRKILEDDVTPREVGEFEITLNSINDYSEYTFNELANLIEKTWDDSYITEARGDK